MQFCSDASGAALHCEAQRRLSLSFERKGMVRMDRNAVQKSFEVWLFVAVAASMNGMFRSLFLTPRVGEYTSHVLSVLTLMIVVLLSSSILVNRLLKEYGNADLFLIGSIWATLTLSVDFVFEHFVLDIPWRAILSDYNLFSGRIWILVLTTELIGPWFMASNRR
jgi:Na+/melibiose symporter-like transporter